LEGVEQFDQPLRLGSSQDISLGQNVSHFVEFEQQFLSHDLKRTDFSSVFLLSEIDLSIATLANLSQDLEVTMSKAGSALA